MLLANAPWKSRYFLAVLPAWAFYKGAVLGYLMLPENRFRV